ncbi:MAG: phage coat protein [Gammaproteobacteria bacterium]|nr:phage coat protein [Gammaproteobacteria bacterium]
MLFQKELIGNSRSAIDQWEEVRRARNGANLQEQMFVSMGQMQVNKGLIPQDVYQEFDNVTVERFRSDDGDTFLNDLLPLSRSLSIGKLVNRFRQASDAGNAQTSMTGQIGVKMDQTEYSYDGSIIPVHDTGFSRNWREWNAMTSEGFDGLIDDQRESVATIRRHLSDSFLDGHTDKAGNFIKVDGLDWQGMRLDSRVAQIDIDASGINFDFTDSSKTGDEIKAAFIQIRDVMWITNKCEKELTYYVSREIASNFERKFSTQYDAKIIMQELADLMGVAAIKVSSKLTGNELMGFPLDSNSIRPMVGMGLNTVAMPRPVYNSNYEFVVWGAIGFEVRTDFAGNTCAFFAHEIA